MLLTKALSDQRRLLVRRKRDVENFDSRILDQRLQTVMGLGDALPLGDFLGVGFGEGRNRNDGEVSLLVARQLDIGHDKARADHPDVIVAAANEGVGLQAVPDAI